MALPLRGSEAGAGVGQVGGREMDGQMAVWVEVWPWCQVPGAFGVVRVVVLSNGTDELRGMRSSFAVLDGCCAVLCYATPIAVSWAAGGGEGRDGRGRRRERE